MKNFLFALILAAGAFSTIANAEVICFTDGTCVDIGDIGIHP
ncbi:hypothetical protein [Yersinia mollaretii]|nr:hypothetical protein [Yersinia mollaretii]MDA5526018.1 hypothetical protein [Yersinia mollaretii]MDA5534219.1 hypothetical protein [Yersinia mollaretii]MDR7872123.1 hypothetical protein [Yersinia mollaretii]WQC73350.1 hypothetical protein U1Z61_12830 [Yersinia mollaretii]